MAPIPPTSSNPDWDGLKLTLEELGIEFMPPKL